MTFDTDTIDDDATVQLVKCVGCENYVLAADCRMDEHKGDYARLACPRCGTVVHPDSIGRFQYMGDA